MPDAADRPRPRGASFIALTRSILATFASLHANRATWTFPLLLVLLVVAALLGVLAMVPAIAPFVYPML
jgi:hypothetical protein